MGEAGCSTLELAEQPMVCHLEMLSSLDAFLSCTAFFLWVAIYSIEIITSQSYDLRMQACCFHGTEPMVAAGLVTGQVQAFRLASNGNASMSAPAEAFTKKPHRESCRATGFSVAGNRLYTASADG
jgi:hypothetical protein